jgi:glutamate-1-semialdehyde 2,1-aminomutase
MAATTATLPYNDIGALRSLFASRGREIAAVIVEPVVGNMGVVPPADGFLEALVVECRTNGALSVFDEVMTGCRVARGGAQERFGVRPDLTCLGKIVGGGMPLAAYGGRRDVMAKVAPLGPVYQAGTLSGNPVAVSAGLATLDRLDPELYARLESLGARLEAGFARAVAKKGARACVQRVGSMVTLFFARGAVRSWADAKDSDTAAFGRWHGAMIERGVYWPPAQFEAAFISAAHTEGDIDVAIEACEAALG